MTDRISPEKRSKVMSAIKSKDTKPELAAKVYMDKLDMEYHPEGIPGHPDFANREAKVVVFVDGCLVHMCPEHCKVPDDIKWRKKLETNRARDKDVTKLLRSFGWLVVRIWEHDIA